MKTILILMSFLASQQKNIQLMRCIENNPTDYTCDSCYYEIYGNYYDSDNIMLFVGTDTISIPNN